MCKHRVVRGLQVYISTMEPVLIYLYYGRPNKSATGNFNIWAFLMPHGTSFLQASKSFTWDNKNTSLTSNTVKYLILSYSKSKMVFKVLFF